MVKTRPSSRKGTSNENKELVVKIPKIDITELSEEVFEGEIPEVSESSSPGNPKQPIDSTPESETGSEVVVVESVEVESRLDSGLTMKGDSGHTDQTALDPDGAGSNKSLGEQGDVSSATGRREAESLRDLIVLEAVKFGNGAQEVAKAALRLFDLFSEQQRMCKELQPSADKGTASSTEVAKPLGGKPPKKKSQQKVDPGKSYAGVAAKVPAPSKGKKPEAKKRAQPEHVVLVYPSDEASPKDLRERLEAGIGIQDLGVEVKKVALTKKGVLIKAGTAADAGTIVAKISGQEELKATPVIPKRLSPRVLIRGVPPYVTLKEVAEKLREQFALEEGEAEVKYPIKRPKTVDWAVEVSSEKYHLVKGKALMVGWSRCRISDCLKPLQCFRCGAYGHRVKNCPHSKERCFNCGKTGHRSKECRTETPSCKNCRLANQAGFKYDTAHSMLSADCPSRAADLRKIRSRTDYGCAKK